MVETRLLKKIINYGSIGKNDLGITDEKLKQVTSPNPWRKEEEKITIF